MTNEFSVVQFFENESYEKVCQWVSADTAVDTFKILTTSIAVRMGLVERVIITDGGDCINMEWQYRKGITFPPQKGKLE